jgi:hypothetical protein
MGLEDGHNFTLSDKEVSTALAKVKTQVDHIRFEGCWVGNGPHHLLHFGRLLRAIDVSGYTWEHVDGAVTVTIPRGATAGSVESLVRPYWKWLAPFPPTSVTQLASMAQNHSVTKTLLVEWYKFADDGEDPPPPWVVQGRSQDLGLGPHGYKRRSEATKHVVQPKDAKPNEEPAPPFEYVTVEIHLGGRILDL